MVLIYSLFPIGYSLLAIPYWLSAIGTPYIPTQEVPSGGDWSIHRGAAVFIEDSSNITVAACTFNQTGGNALMLSNDVTDSAILDNEFVYTGDSAIATLGSSDRIFATEPTYPNRVMIARNHIHEVRRHRCDRRGRPQVTRH